LAATPLVDSNFATRGRGSVGTLALRVVDVALSAGYTVGGYAITPRQLGLGLSGVPLFVITMGDAGGRFYEWLPATNKLMIRDASGAAAAATPEIADATVLTGTTVRLLVIGQGTG
jgi:hypothetical protein